MSNAALDHLQKMRNETLEEIEIQTAAYDAVINKLQGKLGGLDEAIKALSKPRAERSAPAASGKDAKGPAISDAIQEMMMKAPPEGIRQKDLTDTLMSQHEGMKKSSIYGAVSRLQNQRKLVKESGFLRLPPRNGNRDNISE